MAGLITDIQEKISVKKEEIAWMGDNIVLLDTKKEKWDNAVLRVDAHASREIEAVNTTILDVSQAYKDRITAGCWTDLFWRVVGHTTAQGAGSNSTPEQWTLQCTKLNEVGYAGIGTGPGTSLTLYNGGVSGVTTLPLDSKYGFEVDFFHGLKTFDEPWTKDIGDTTVGSFIGTVGTGSTILTIMQPNSQGLGEGFEVGQLLTCEKDGIISGTHNTIAGFGATVVDLTGISTVGTATTMTEVTTIILDTLTVGFASVPPAGEYVTFTVSDDPVSISTYSDYKIPWAKNPMSPQTIGIMGSGPLGVGTFVQYDNTGISSNTQSWRPENRTDNLPSKVQNKLDEDEKVEPPQVGAGRIYYRVGFDEGPLNGILGGGGLASEGDVRIIQTTFFGSTLYQDLPACSAEEANLSSKVGIRNSKESAFSSDIGTFNGTVSAGNALRIERNSYEQQIWGIRMTIGEELRQISEYDSLDNYIDTYPDIIDP